MDGEAEKPAHAAPMPPDQSLEDAVERSMIDLAIERTARNSMSPGAAEGDAAKAPDAPRDDR
jgi:hypothetical protein